MGDHRTYDHLIAIRAVTTDDFMTADWAKIPYDVLARISNRITNEVDHVNRVVYDITSKPPGERWSGNNTIPQGCERNSFTAFFTLTFIIQNILQITNTPLTLLSFCTIILHKRTFLALCIR